MTVELRPLGVTCNIQCQYCYQQPQRDAGNLSHRYDIEQMKAAILEEGGPFTLFGGEPLLVPLKDLEELWSWGFQQFGVNTVQTNGILITDAHIELFKKYNVRVGISLDGPGELNDVRWYGTLERTRQSTEKAQNAIERLCREWIPPCIIITLHRYNARRDRLPDLFKWVMELDAMGIMNARLHLLESENEVIRQKYGLTDEENIKALLAFADLQTRLVHLRFDIFADLLQLLTGQDEGTTCIWNACDPYTTAAVRGVEGHGQKSNCGRTNKEGIDFIKSNSEGFERYLALYHTPQSVGGCKDCRFFLMCKGQCPGTAIDGDWRNRTEHCRVWMTLYERLEQEMLAAGEEPLSLSPKREEIERAFIDKWSRGKNTSIALVLRELSELQTGLDVSGSRNAEKQPGQL